MYFTLWKSLAVAAVAIPIVDAHLIYAYPLYIFGNFAGAVLRNVSVNQIFHQCTLAAIGSSAVINPNVDTVYSRAVLGLSTHDVILSIPEVTDRYWVYPVYDSFGNTIATIGIVNNNTAGDYLIRRADDVGGKPGFYNDSSIVQSGIDSLQETTRYAGVVNLPTTYGTILIRYLVLQNTTSDLNIIRKYQNASSLTEVPRAASYAPSPPNNASLSSLAPNSSLLGIDTPAKLLDFASRFVLYNQPEVVSERQRVAGKATSGNFLLKPIKATLERTTPIAGYQQLPAQQVLYPGYRSTGFTSQFSLAPNQSLLWTFSGKPPVQAQDFGFWSVTVYGDDQYLIPNPIGRSSVSDRTWNLTYQGTNQTIYGPNANSTTNGPFQILLQPSDIPPPANWTSNWLPVSRNFSFITRWYVPYPGLTNGSYVYSKIETINAIR
ncbi:hypothetical protein C7974DRAFT_473159 [Boeremia exigua]|uniref:uncharacterized protein n=1 Tax=Boeremia exigua TaxID=749465 RepID=UPI001E8D3A66|nr:uncharacterized protein C7974DRAFT_473159 [Boeremia exigua]KAH6625909.1 hypothetical protein C7974DRAFT_473159 [Boeremia exigua]